MPPQRLFPLPLLLWKISSLICQGIWVGTAQQRQLLCANVLMTIILSRQFMLTLTFTLIHTFTKFSPTTTVCLITKFDPTTMNSPTTMIQTLITI